MTEKRQAKDMICPDLTIAKAIILAVRLQDSVDVDMEAVMCKGKDCAMFNPTDRKCGKRFR